MKNQNNDAAISDADLDKVAGGFFAAIFASIRAKISAGTDGGSGGGCRNDPCAQFQQILQQLTGPG